MYQLGYKIIDLHTHLRNDILFHTRLAKEAGFSTLVYMPNTKPCLDNVEAIRRSLKFKREVETFPVSAITIGRKGKKLVNIKKIKPYVAGFSDDGDCLKNLKLLAEALKTGVLVMAHLEPETQMAAKYLKVLEGVGGRLHFQHISKSKTVKLLKSAKRKGLKFTAETCPQYFTYSSEVENFQVNPPLGDLEDIKAVKKGLKDGTIDCISSDYAPMPRPKNTGIASFASFAPLCFGLVMDKTLTKKQLKDKIHNNPLKIIS